MSTIKADQLDGQLARGLAPVYVIHGDEPLLSLEAGDAIRATARSRGFTEREVHQVERGYDWSRLAQSAASMSLFGDRKLIEVRLPSGKPGTEGAAALSAYCGKLPTDTMLMLSLPRLDKAGQSAAWFNGLDRVGVVVNVFGIDRAQLPQWLAARLHKQSQRASHEALSFITECVEGNLLAAHQEIQKLGLLFPPGELSFEQVRGAVLDVARFDVYQISEALLAGDIKRLARVLDGLRGEGEAPNRVLWMMSEDLRAVLRLQSANGRSAQDIFRENRIWGPKQTLVSAAARRLGRDMLERALAQAASVDRMIKGLSRGDAWDELLQLGVALGR
ncbi:MAG TPA: DNA polymerase III subunit delta [Burkholderiales bacterium]|nr:DNA polymerase III subunit delta [Burkholderiales bacterium]